MASAHFNVDGSLKHFLAIQREQRELELRQHSAIIGLSQEVDACFEWVETTLADFAKSIAAPSHMAYVYQRISDISICTPEMLEPEVGAWLTASSDEHAVLVWTSPSLGFTVYNDVVEQDSEVYTSYHANIERRYDIHEPRTPYTYGSIEEWASGILVMASTLQRALEKNLS